MRMFNVFEQALPLKRRQTVEEIKNTMIQQGALGACMSGSGPTVFGIFREESRAQAAVEELKQNYADTFLTVPV